MVAVSPLIGVSGGGAGIPNMPDLYLNAVLDAGGSPCCLHPEADVAAAVARHDGFLIPGGRDVDPRLYDEEVIPKTELEDRRRMEFECRLVLEAVKSGKPVLGICYGMQLLNVVLGGALYQDVADQVPGALSHRGCVHPVTIRPNPFLPAGEFEVNSSHHQAVRTLGDGLRVMAEAGDGLIEALYREGDGYVLGVQWHPERLTHHLTRLIFGSFIGAASAGCRCGDGT